MNLLFLLFLNTEKKNVYPKTKYKEGRLTKEKNMLEEKGKFH
jgi:hypothetical protein